MTDRVLLAHGFGGALSQELLDTVILPPLSGSAGHAITLDAAVVSDLTLPLAISTDGFTVSPRFFPGGDMGTLAAAGTINDLAMRGARPDYLTLALVIEEGFPVAELSRLLTSFGDSCRSTGTRIVSGDTKVVERGGIDGLIMTTTGIGSIIHGPFGPDRIRPGDVLMISGTIGDHGAAILNEREHLGSSSLASDCAPLFDLVSCAAHAGGDDLHALRDPTRGGLAAVLNEFAVDTGLTLAVNESSIPIRPAVRSFLTVLGMDVLTLANEGKAVLAVAPKAAQTVLEAFRSHPLGRDAAIIGEVETSTGPGRVMLTTPIGTRRILEPPREAGLPRIC